MRTEQGTVLRASPLPGARERVLARPEYEGVFGLLLLGILLISTLDEAAAPVARGLVLACFAPLMIVNVGAALGVYIGAALVFSVHHFAGQGSWVERPDNYALLFLTFCLVFGRSFGRTAGALGWTAVAVALLVGIGLLHLIALVGFSTVELTWFMRMFGIPLGLFVLLRRAALSTREVHAMCLIVASLAIYVALISVFEAFGWYFLIVPPWIRDAPEFGTGRVGGLSMHSEWNALVISLAFCVLLLRLNLKQIRSSVGWLIGGGVCLVAIYFTYTRGAWLGLVVGGVPLFWQMSAMRGVTVRRRALFVAFMLGFTILVVFFPSDILQARVSDTGTMYFRLHIWAAGLRLAAEHPLLGVGFGQFGSQFGPYVRELGPIPLSTGLESGGTAAHNTLVSVAAEFGLVGLTLYLIVVLGIYRATRVAAATAWGQQGRSWVAGFTLVYLINVQFIVAHELVSNLLYFGVMGAIAGMRGFQEGPVKSTVSVPDSDSPGELRSDRDSHR
jgi:O-antigen ligase